MSNISRAFLMFSLAVAALAFTGCQSFQPTTTPNESGFAGGDGVFGENPVSPGAYNNVSPSIAPPLATASVH